ncbi:hypothetical protein J1P26_17160 [Neobacillus sp. MM2021_6]|uniref:hypothetical protein n=1 Tax=Bacillaceae TaxID=186817 RepID=UPI00140BB564|nr:MULTISPECIES: hypothetical protein [Bacillaceae]MBO0961437.1 hypothetical protein [Neobacillus sp. MM2021_6]NHC19542.1 hypothetical protein [Bacillus sp. MM2020_4]
MSLRESILLLKQAKQFLDQIESSYPVYLTQREASEELQIQIKDFLDKVNPALDFAAYHIFNTYCIPHVKGDLGRAEAKVYFPLRDTNKAFDHYIKNIYPGLLEQRPDIVDVLRKYQPFPTRPKWLFHLRELAKHNKHRNLTKQSFRQSTHIDNLTFPGGGGIRGITIVNSNDVSAVSYYGQSIDFQNPNNIPDYFNYSGSVDYDFVFIDINQPVLNTLKRIYRSAPTVIYDLEKIL